MVTINDYIVQEGWGWDGSPEHRQKLVAERLVMPLLLPLLYYVGEKFFRIEKKSYRLFEWIYGIPTELGECERLAVLHADWLLAETPKTFYPDEIQRLCGDNAVDGKTGKLKSVFWHPGNHNLLNKKFEDRDKLEKFVSFSLSGSEYCYEMIPKNNELLRSWLMIHVNYDDNLLMFRAFPFCCDRCKCGSEVDENGICPNTPEACRSIIAYKEKGNAAYALIHHERQLRFFAQNCRSPIPLRFCRKCQKRVSFVNVKGMGYCCTFCRERTNGGESHFWFPNPIIDQFPKQIHDPRQNESRVEIVELLTRVAKHLKVDSKIIAKLCVIDSKLEEEEELSELEKEFLRKQPVSTLGAIGQYIWDCLEYETFNQISEMPDNEFAAKVEKARQILRVCHDRPTERGLGND